MSSKSLTSVRTPQKITAHSVQSSQIGAEEYALLFLLEQATTIHEVRSAFACELIRGWVYLECTMNRDLVSLLERTPGIVQSRQGLQWRNIPFSDWTNTLSMRPSSTVPQQGKWVRVRNGTYGGDVGVVIWAYSWGVDVLLVPRLRAPDSRSPTPEPQTPLMPEPRTSLTPEPPQTSSTPDLPQTSSTLQPPSTSLKRKRTSSTPEPQKKRKRPPPAAQALFDPHSNLVKKISRTSPTPKRQRDGVYTFAGSSFEHGLIRKTYRVQSVSSATSIPLEVLHLYSSAEHPFLVNIAIPRPLEWIFETGEAVAIRSSQKKGVVRVVGIDGVEVDLDNFEGLTVVTWGDICKRFDTGDFVLVLGGPFLGKTGWILNVENETACIVDKIVKGAILTTDSSRALDVRRIEV